MRLRNRGVLLFLAGLLSGGCAGTGPAMDATPGTPVLELIGEQLLRYLDTQLEVVVDYRFASLNLGEPWLILNLGVKGTKAENASIARAGVRVESPPGERHPLPTQKSFLESFSTAQGLVRRARVVNRPLLYTRSNRRPCDLNFLALPGEGITRDVIFVNNASMCTGMLLFPVKQGVQPGRWRLVLEVGESTIRIPIPIGIES